MIALSGKKAFLIKTVFAFVIHAALASCAAFFPLLTYENGKIVTSNIPANLLIRFFAFFIPAFFLIKEVKIQPETMQKHSGMNVLWDYAVFPCAYGIVAVFSQVFSCISFLLSKIGINTASYTQPLPSETKDILIYFFFSVVFPAIFEELFFRKLFIDRLFVFGRPFAILLSSAFFAFSHSTPEQIFFAFFAGIFFGCLYLRSGSCIPCILAHFFNNALYFFDMSGLFPTLPKIIITSVGFVCAVIFVSFFFIKNKQDENKISRKDIPFIFLILTFCIKFIMSVL